LLRMLRAGCFQMPAHCYVVSSEGLQGKNPREVVEVRVLLWGLYERRVCKARVLFNPGLD
jgi:hypothetical protein